MKLANIFAVAFASLLSAPLANACKCVDALGKVNDLTQTCCGVVGGNFQYGEDCQADSISESLRAFEYCCATVGTEIFGTAALSDCDYP